MKRMTEGNPVKLIVAFAVPMIIGNLFEILYSLVDSLIVSRILGVHALAAVGAVSSVSYMIIGFAIGFTSGVSIIIAQRFGAGDMGMVRRSFLTALILCAAISLSLTIIGIITIRPLLELLQTPYEIIDSSLSYASVLIGGIAVQVFSVMLGNVLRAVGNSRAPLVFLTAACLSKILLDFLFVGGLGMGVSGAALATVAAQLCSGTLCWLYTFKIKELRIRSEDICVSWSEIWTHLRIGLPMAFQVSVISIGALVVQFTLNHIGPEAIAAFSATDKLDQITITILNSVGLTMATYTAQNYGAGQYDRIKRGVIGIGKLLLIFALVMSVVNFLAGRHFAVLFAPGDEVVIDLIYTGLRIDAVGFLFLILVFVSRNVLQGLSRTALAFSGSIMELIMRVVAALLLSGRLGYVGICLSNPLAWTGAGVLMTVAMTMCLYKLPNNTANKVK